MVTPLARILIADDEPLFLRTTGELLTKAGYDCVMVADAKSALSELQAGHYDLMLSDLHMPGNFHGELLRAQREGWPQVPLIVVTGVPSLPTAIESIRLGIADYLLKPVRYEELLASVRRALAKAVPQPARPPVGDTTALPFIGDCPAIRSVRETCVRAAQSDAAILISGEHGTGKHFVAKMIHETSRHRGLPLAQLRCASGLSPPADPTLVTPGSRANLIEEIVVALDESAPIYLSSLEALSLDLQHALLRHLQLLSTGSMRQSRLISSTRCDLLALAQSGQFLDELFYRLAVIQIRLPPLRERGADIELLARHFLAQHSQRVGAMLEMDDKVTEVLYQHAWPGNVQELKNAIDHAATMADEPVVRCEHLPPGLYVPREVAVTNSRSSRDCAVGHAERQYLMNLLRENRGNIAKSAREAGLSRQGLHKLLARYGIKPDPFRGAP